MKKVDITSEFIQYTLNKSESKMMVKFVNEFSPTCPHFVWKPRSTVDEYKITSKVRVAFCSKLDKPCIFKHCPRMKK